MSQPVDFIGLNTFIYEPSGWFPPDQQPSAFDDRDPNNLHFAVVFNSSSEHIPTDNEWSTMTDELGGSSVAGDMMKTTFGWNSEGGTNTSGFSGLPGGNRGLQGENSGGGLYGDWWTSTPNSGSAWLRNLYSDRESVDRYLAAAITGGLSVRCIKD